MEKENIKLPVSDSEILNDINLIKQSVKENKTKEVTAVLFNMIDLTSLNTADTVGNIKKMTDKVSEFNSVFPNLNNVAAICVYPSFIDTVKQNLRDKNVKIASVGACFPSSQSFISVKAAECDLCIKKGAQEIDIVIPVGMFLEGKYENVISEISFLKSTIGNNCLKVILETGELQNLQNIYTASILSMEAGADFIKTSTGKTQVSATPEAVYTMCLAIKDFYKKSGKKIGIKPSGGMATTEDALLYYLIVNKILGKDWLNNKLMRLGTSKLANIMLSELYPEDKEKGNYF